MKTENVLGSQIIIIVDNQLQSGNPPETRRTFDRLKHSGYTEEQAKQLIGHCVVVELCDVIKSGKKFDEDRYTRNLMRLPDEPVSVYSNESANRIMRKREK